MDKGIEPNGEGVRVKVIKTFFVVLSAFFVRTTFSEKMKNQISSYHKIYLVPLSLHYTKRKK